MSLAPGTRVGTYEVIAPLGAGGMGEVYRARDTRLKRDVALKVLPEDFASDPDRLARFQREAEVLAALNHPHIAHIHGFEEADGVRALVLELVEGPTLDGRFLLVTVEAAAKTRSDVWILSLRQNNAAAPLLQQEFDQSQGAVSPNGRWLAYISNESGVNEVFVRPFMVIREAGSRRRAQRRSSPAVELCLRDGAATARSCSTNRPPAV